MNDMLMNDMLMNDMRKINMINMKNIIAHMAPSERDADYELIDSIRDIFGDRNASDFLNLSEDAIYDEIEESGRFYESVNRAIDDFYYDLRLWAMDNYDYIDQAMEEGLCEGCKNFHELIRWGQYEYHREQAVESLKVLIEKIKDEIEEADERTIQKEAFIKLLQKDGWQTKQGIEKSWRKEEYLRGYIGNVSSLGNGRVWYTELFTITDLPGVPRKIEIDKQSLATNMLVVDDEGDFIGNIEEQELLQKYCDKRFKEIDYDLFMPDKDDKKQQAKRDGHIIKISEETFGIIKRELPCYSREGGNSVIIETCLLDPEQFKRMVDLCEIKDPEQLDSYEFVMIHC